jgi:hypothetical protein
MVAWCRGWLGADPVEVLFRAGYLSEVTGLRLADGRGVVVKARAPSARLRGGAGRPGRPWAAGERQACWAAGLWVRAFNAKKQRMAGGGPDLDRLAAELPERAGRAGLRV